MRWTLCVLAGLTVAAGLHAATTLPRCRSPVSERPAPIQPPPQPPPPRQPRASTRSPATRAWWCSRTWATSRTIRCRSCVCSLYSNEIDLEGLVATTSTWQRKATHPETMRAMIAAYGEVRQNLLKHAAGWPEAGRLDALVAPGQPAYGMAAVGAGQDDARRRGHRARRRPERSAAALDQRLGRRQHAGPGAAARPRHPLTRRGRDSSSRSCVSTRSPTRTTPGRGSGASSRACSTS